MFDRFTDRARKVMGLARQEAQRFNHDYIGTEHILLGLVREGSGVAASVLVATFLIDSRKIREEVEKLVQFGTEEVTVGHLPFTPRAKRVLELSLEEASNLGLTYVGTEHLLLGLIREREGIAAQVLRNLEVKVEDVREEVIELLGVVPPDPDGAWPSAALRMAPLGPPPKRVRGPSFFEPGAALALTEAIGLAGRFGGVLDADHLFFGVVRALSAQPELAARLRPALDLVPFRADEVATLVSYGEGAEEVHFLPSALALLSIAFASAAARGASRTDVWDLLSAILSADEGAPSDLLRSARIDRAAVIEHLRRLRARPPETPP